MKITKIFEFEAAHRLPFHKGKCQYLHGHTYKLEVTVGGSVDIKSNSSTKGMVIDFGMLKGMVEDLIISKYDHSLLNDWDTNPTVENLAQAIFVVLNDSIKATNEMNEKMAGKYSYIPDGPGDLYLHRIRLWETSTSYVEVP